MNIALFGTIDWEFKFWQRPHHIVNRLVSRGHRVIYFNPTCLPPNRVTQVFPRPYADIFDLGFDLTNRQDIRRALRASRLAIVNPIAFFPMSVVNLVRTHSLERYLTENLIATLLKQAGFEEALVWLNLPYWFPLISSIPRRGLVYECIDDVSGWSDLPDADDFERPLFKAADLVFVSSQKLMDKAQRCTEPEKVVSVPNAVEVDHFEKALDDLLVPHDLTGLRKPIIGYMGNTAPEAFDAELVAYLARARPEWSFVILGNTGHDVDTLLPFPNVYPLGVKKYFELPAYIRLFDAAIIPFRLNDLTLAVSPVKFFEFLAAGKPVVSTDLPEVSRFEPIARIGRSPEEFLSHIEAALQESDTAAAARRAIAKDNDWSKRVKLIEENLATITKKKSPSETYRTADAARASMTRQVWAFFAGGSHRGNTEPDTGKKGRTEG